MTQVEEVSVEELSSQQAPQPATVQNPPAAAVQLALQAGWTMAVLYGTIQEPRASSAAHLPTVHELPPGQRRDLELVRLRHLLTRLAERPECHGAGVPLKVPVLSTPAAPHAKELKELNLAILKGVASAHPEIELAYELGRSLRDTANPPLASEGREAPAAALKAKLGHGRIAKLQEWLCTLAPAFPSHAAAAVAASLGHWRDFTVHALAASPGAGGGHGPGTAEVAAKMQEYLLEQGDAWLMLLTGTRSTAGLITPEGYAAAGEAALRRSAEIVGKIVRRYWPVWVVLGVTLAALLSLSIAYLSGAAKVWTAIATVAGSLGVTGRTITSAASRLAAEAERPVFAMAEEDAMAWALTTIPPIGLPASDVRQLRKAGVEPPSGLRRAPGAADLAARQLRRVLGRLRRGVRKPLA